MFNKLYVLRFCSGGCILRVGFFIIKMYIYIMVSIVGSLEFNSNMKLISIWGYGDCLLDGFWVLVFNLCWMK